MSDKTRSENDGDDIECPRCGGKIHDLSDLEISGDYEHCETECETCCATVKVTMRLTRFYTAKIA